MLAHSPPLPLVIDYFDEYRGITTEDEEGTILALKQRDRVRRVRLDMPVSDLQKLIVAIEDEYPILEYLIIWNRVKDNTILMFPETLQAPRLSHLALVGFDPLIGSRLLTSPMGLVTLCLVMKNPSTYFRPNTLLQWLSFMPQLEALVISFLYSPNRDVESVERQIQHTPVITPVILPNFRYFMFRGETTHLETLVHRITPCPEKLEICFFNQRSFSVPRLLQFMNATENLTFESVKFQFSRWQVFMAVYPRGVVESALSIVVICLTRNLYLQVSSVAQISHSLRPVFSAVEHLVLEHEADSQSSEERVVGHNEADRQWHELFSVFSNVKTLRIDNGLVEGVSRCLKFDDGELPSELLPELKELIYSGSGKTGDAFAPFIHARESAGRPVTLTCC